MIDRRTNERTAVTRPLAQDQFVLMEHQYTQLRNERTQDGNSLDGSTSRSVEIFRAESWVLLLSFEGAADN